MSIQPTPNKGIALISVLIIMAILTVITVKTLYTNKISLENTTYITHLNQALFYALSLEEWARRGLELEGKETKYDGLDEIWAQEFTFPIEGGLISANAIDLQSRFNLNSLITKDDLPHLVMISKFKSLLRNLEYDESRASVFVDWIDKNTLPLDGAGAEDNAYTIENPSYITANQSFSHISEISLLSGFNQDDKEKLEPFVTFIPSIDVYQVNVNTASKKVLEAMGITGDISAQRPIKNIAAISAFLTDKDLAGYFVVKSQFFLLNVTVAFGVGKVVLHSIILRNEQNKAFILFRELSYLNV